QKNISENELFSEFSVFLCDWRKSGEKLKKRKYDAVLANPPYVKKGSGRVSPNDARQAARCEEFGGLGELIEAVARHLKDDGSAYFCYAFSRFEELRDELRKAGFGLSRVSYYRGKKGADPAFVCVEARRGFENSDTVEADVFI
ncbi:MAG: hypothetical protein KAR06_08390, partial [Deltaproteobacteria bacterium]|nr:hypothetical protein [Deltaproteobacteria bacterium]